MPITAKAKPSAGNFDRFTFDEGLHNFKLVKAWVYLGKPTTFKNQPKPAAPKIALIWEKTDGDEEEGQGKELFDAIGCPKDFAYNDKGAIWKRIEGLAGVKINEDNIELFSIDLGEFIESYDELLQEIHKPHPQNADKTQSVEIKSMKWDGQKLLGMEAQLVLKIWEGQNGTGNNIDSILALKGNKKKGKASAPAAAPKPASPAAPAVAPAPTERMFWVTNNGEVAAMTETELKNFHAAGFDGPVMLQGEEEWKTLADYGLKSTPAPVAPAGPPATPAGMP